VILFVADTVVQTGELEAIGIMVLLPFALLYSYVPGGPASLAVAAGVALWNRFRPGRTPVWVPLGVALAASSVAIETLLLGGRDGGMLAVGGWVQYAGFWIAVHIVPALIVWWIADLIHRRRLRMAPPAEAIPPG